MKADLVCVLPEYGCVVVEMVKVVYERADTVWIVVRKIDLAVLLFL
jgi:hypothetical protein